MQTNNREVSITDKGITLPAGKQWDVTKIYCEEDHLTIMPAPSELINESIAFTIMNGQLATFTCVKEGKWLGQQTTI